MATLVYIRVAVEDVAGVVDRLDPGQPFVFGRSVGSPHPVILEHRAGI